MRILGPGAFVAAVAYAFATGCATGGPAGGDNGNGDSGIIAKDSGATKDSGGGTKDSGGPTQDSGGPVQDSGGGGNCGGQCLGTLSTCCNNQCVDITSDPNNCGGCNNPCGTQSCCAGACVDTMGSDNSNCGGCGVTCAGTCTNGQCQTGGGSCTLDKGTCAHSPCTTGAALSDGCDPELVTLYVCDVDGLTGCCTTTWDQSCVDDASFWETNSCIGSGC